MAGPADGMEALLTLQAVAIALLAVLVGGLLRSHAEILRALHRLGADVVEDAGTPLGAPRRRQPPLPAAAAATAVDVAGRAPAGEAVRVAVRDSRHDTLLAFLTTGCATCSEFWRAFGQPPSRLQLPEGTRLVIVTKGEAEESAARLLALAPSALPVVMSSEAWAAYGVPTTPYFIHVDGPTGRIVGQGSGHSWDQVTSLLRQAVGDDEAAADVDRKLLAAGIRPGDPSLYGSRKEDEA